MINSTLNNGNSTGAGYMFATLRSYNASEPNVTPNTSPTNTSSSGNDQQRGKRTSLAMCVPFSFCVRHKLILRSRIILYVITGCVSALFIIVIVSGVRCTPGFVTSWLTMSVRPSERSGTPNDTDLGALIQPILTSTLKVVPRVWPELSWTHSLSSSSANQKSRFDPRRMWKPGVWNCRIGR